MRIDRLGRGFGSFAVAFLLPMLCVAQEISDPRRLLFVADNADPVIDVIDVRENTVIHRIETTHPVDDLVATPNAPILIYTNIEQSQVTFYDLKNRRAVFVVDVAVAPRHIVLSPRGDRVAVTDSIDGGFLLLSAWSGDVIIELPEFAPTSDVLFDPNEVDIYFSNSQRGALGFIDTNTRQVFEVDVTEPGSRLSSPSRSLDARYIYVANETTGEVHSLNAFSRVLFRSFHIGDTPARPYTTPEGSFLYMLDEASGRFVSIEQFNFEQFADVTLIKGADLVTVGRFDRLNLFASTRHREFEIFDNSRISSVYSGEFDHSPVDMQGSADGRLAYVAFGDAPQIAVFDLERRQIEYIDATNNGVAAMSLGLSNNVCH
jgi:DNA-binding beta-propeller fold protein YncE